LFDGDLARPILLERIAIVLSLLKLSLEKTSLLLFPAPIACIFENMQPSKEQIEEYRKAYAEEFGKEISPEEACEQLMNLVELLEVISKPPFPTRFDAGRQI
jgi:hypothetical protein